MRKALVSILFVLQVYLILKGTQHFTMLQTPFIIFSISIAIAFVYINWLLKRDDRRPGTLHFNSSFFSGAAFGLVSIVATYSTFRKAFDNHKDYGSFSDVIPQLETLFQRFANGIFPYAPLEQYPWHPYPVYMPLNWLPVGLAGPLQCDVRWIGVLFLGIAISIWGAFAWSSKTTILSRTAALVLPSLAIFLFLEWDPTGMAVSFETLIAAYYLLLVLGLFSQNLTLITIGIIACLLSRYTFVFWLPVFFILLWQNAPRIKSYAVWVSILISVFALYLLPFYFRQPSILMEGIAYHNRCYIDAWNGLGHPEQSTAFDLGLNFSWFVREITSGEMAGRVFVARVIQGGLMLFLAAGFVLVYNRCKQRINFYDYSLLALYIIVLVFYMFSPLTYMYYYIPFLMVSAALCAKVLLTPKINGQ